MIENIKQRLLNQTLKQEEQNLFYLEESKSPYPIVSNIANLLMLGAKPVDYNIYGLVIRTMVKMNNEGLFHYSQSIDSLLLYLNSILDGDSKDVQHSFFNILQTNLEYNYNLTLQS
jgi:hypothetical protein